MAAVPLTRLSDRKLVKNALLSLSLIIFLGGVALSLSQVYSSNNQVLGASIVPTLTHTPTPSPVQLLDN